MVTLNQVEVSTFAANIITGGVSLPSGANGMASITQSFESGEQVHVDRENWFSAETQALLKAACENPDIGAHRVLATVLHDGLGLSLDLTAQLVGSTKSKIEKRVASGRKRMRREAKILARNSLFAV
jgi:hypothetical protein